MNFLTKLNKSGHLKRFLTHPKAFSTSTNTNSLSNTPPAEHYDIIIVGGGPVGLSLACAISKNTKLSDKKVLLLDGAPQFKGYATDKISNRVYSLNACTVDLMKSIGAWDIVTGIRYHPVKHMQVWDGVSDACITFANDNNISYIVENDVLVHAILEEMRKNENVTLANSSKIKEVHLAAENDDTGSVILQNGEKYSCDLLIGADGANSVVRNAMGIENFALSYNQMGIIATMKLAEPGNNYVAWQRFLRDGVIALLPVSNELSSIVWSTSIAKAKKLQQLPEEEFLDKLNEAFFSESPKDHIIDATMKAIKGLVRSTGTTTVRQCPPKLESIYENSRAIFPLGFGHSSSYVAKGTVLVGDSAHRVHPLAGLGLNLGFGDVKCLVDRMGESVYNGFGLGDTKYLLKYEQERLKHNVPVMLSIHGLQKLYSTDFAPIVQIRSAGLELLQALSPIKNLIMKRAMS